MFSPLGQWEWIFNLTPLGQRHSQMVKKVHGITKNIIQKKKAELTIESSNSNMNDSIENDIGTKKKLTLLELLLQSTIDGQPLTEEDIREEVETFMFAGHDTTTTGTAAVFYYLSKNPEIQQKVYEEIISVFGNDPTTPVTYNDLQDLKYMEMVMKESFRLIPPVPVMGRQLMEPTVISGVLCRSGTNIAIPIYAHHRNPEIFPDPEKFDPDRFLPKNTEHRSPYSYIPFSAGPRNCIGQKYAMVEIKTFITKVLLNYKLLPNKGEWKLKVRLAFVLEMNGIEMRIETRK